jgi:hypothetical protein
MRTSRAQTSRVTAAIAAGVMLAGCTTSVDGTARPAHSAGLIGVGSSIAQVLPNDAELSAALGIRVSTSGEPPVVGGPDMMPDGIRDNTDASEIQCLGVTHPLMKWVFKNAPVRAAAYSLANLNISFGVVALASPSDARALFSAFADQWRQCQGKTMVVYHAEGGPDLLHAITAVNASDAMLTAMVMASSPADRTAPFPDERALGVAANCIVDVEVSDTSWHPADPPPDNQAATIANLMLTRVSTAT